MIWYYASMILLEEHKKVYDALANEYEDRSVRLKPVTEETVKELSYFLPRGEVLDVGCGVGTAVSVLKEFNFDAIGIDISKSMVKFARKRNFDSEIILGDFIKYGFSQQFDGIFCFAFIHLFPKNLAEKILEKIHNLLVDNGILYIGTTRSVKSTEGYVLKKDCVIKEKHCRKFWTKKELIASLKAANFIILNSVEFKGPYGKVWMDFIARKV